MMMLSVVLGILLIGLIIIGQKLAQKMAAQNKAATPATQATGALPPEPEASRIPVAQHYKSDKVGNDAAARPWDHGAETTPRTASNHKGWEQTPVSTLSFRPDQLPDRVPAHFDLALLLERSKEAFMRLKKDGIWANAPDENGYVLIDPATKHPLQDRNGHWFRVTKEDVAAFAEAYALPSEEDYLP